MYCRAEESDRCIGRIADSFADSSRRESTDGLLSTVSFTYCGPVQVYS